MQYSPLFSHRKYLPRSSYLTLHPVFRKPATLFAVTFPIEVQIHRRRATAIAAQQIALNSLALIEKAARVLAAAIT